ncbi:hypothetical protein MVLG_00260 [Microbotryum lychnidis-dioicae p1A1 Lamole]|uniref:Secreted protein n=1 Tax=Microbotryum lychnidis-dioicae (strain p1A1 Lamole / MvSl-1064) TaxID=683840 RepID=U5GYJ3_USTV1|nr:hypothetical protein MVLG_00260 [Microbotryum lychnidis-dioicae p1A1 Lamole]|eukprot:KDE09862.1 hypothetical protein MVLG_00260 [Microbotryum lychnidis-dioicae p1A1 Lamole]
MKLSLLIVVVVAAGTTHSVPVPAPILGIPVRTEFMPGKPGFSVATKLVSLLSSGMSALNKGAKASSSTSSGTTSSLGSLMKRDSPVKYKRACPFLAGSSGLGSGSDSLKSLSSFMKKREESPELAKRSCPFLAGGSAKLGSDYVHTLSRLVKREKDAQVDERS